MKLPMIALISAIAGSATAVTVFTINKQIEQRQQQDYLAQSALHATPLKQVQFPPIPDLPELPPGALPLDATPTPGYTPEAGSIRPGIQLKPGFSLPGQPKQSSASLFLVKTKETVATTRDPIWTLQLVVNGQVVGNLPALTGRVDRQNLNRHQAGNKSPLPPGTYSVDRYSIERGPFDDPELGRGYWVPISPLFRTQRSALGFHQDPSWGKRNGESGTSGCIGLESAEATAKLVEWIKHYNIRELTVAS